jgi:hypothetical protein
MNDRNDFLRLFQGDEVSHRHFTVLRKGGHPFLYLPGNPLMADATLRLYPAQRVFARSLVGLIRGFMRFGIPVSRQGVDFIIDVSAGFPAFLKLVASGNKTVPDFGILANRFKDSGRPHVLLLFDADNQPAIVVKVGTSKEARQLIRVEQELFFPETPAFLCLPKALDWYEGEDATAIAYRYIEGANPKPGQHGEIESLLNSWVRDEESVRLGELSFWSRLESLLQDNPGLESVLQILQGSRIKPVLFHGDFAPWNIRVPSSEATSPWVVLDWEQGAHRGVPGWDWIHFILQYHTLVRRLSPQATLSEIEALWESPAFRAYARRTGIEPILRELTFIFLFYFLRYSDPRENAVTARKILQLFNARYFPDILPSVPPLKINEILRPHFEKSIHYLNHG